MGISLDVFITICILDGCMLVWYSIIGVITMRKEDEQAIKRAMAILKVECQEHRSCNTCAFYKHGDCILNMPPMHYNIDEIIKCFT